MAEAMYDLKSITHDPEYYAEAFDVFARRSEKYEVLAAWIDTVFPNVVVEKLSVIAEKGRVDKLRMIGIGSGTGDAECKMITQLLKKFSSISNTVIEPSLPHIEKYRYKILVDDESFGNVEFDWRQHTWDDFYNEYKQKAQAKKFHFISAIHSLYYVADLEKTILDLMSCLEEGGVLLMILLSDESGTSRLWNRFPMFADDHHNQCNSGSIRRILDKNNIKYEVMTQESSVDITCCFEEGNNEGILMTDFLNHVGKLREKATDCFVQEVLAYMRGGDCSIQKGDKIVHNNDWRAVVVLK